MLIKFSSVATGSITMFGADAKLLIKMLGASDTLPNAVGAEDIPAGLKRLRQQLDMHASTAIGVSDPKDEDQADYEPPIALASRARPLVEILERAAAAKAAVMWEQA